MKCPVCTNIDLVMTERSGVEIDYCPQCRGVWLDRGELDKIVERSGSRAQSSQYAQSTHAPRSEHVTNVHHDNDYGHHKKHKKEGFLGDLFDF